MQNLEAGEKKKGRYTIEFKDLDPNVEYKFGASTLVNGKVISKLLNSKTKKENQKDKEKEKDMVHQFSSEESNTSSNGSLVKRVKSINPENPED